VAKLSLINRELKREATVVMRLAWHSKNCQEIRAHAVYATVAILPAVLAEPSASSDWPASNCAISQCVVRSPV
jgi:hypothetical protein